MFFKKKVKAAVVIFVYEASSKYFISLIDSLNNQSVSNFEIIIFNDDAKESIKYFKKLKVKHHIFNLLKDTPTGIRFQGFKILKGLNFDFYIFQDCDDELSKSRVKDVILIAKDFKIVVNDLDLIDKFSNIYELKIWKNRFLDKSIFNHNDILNYNFIGLGNTTIHKSLFDFFPRRPKVDIPALDWYIFYTVLKTSLINGFFTSSCSTQYRQHSDNEIGIAEVDKLNHIIEIKNAFNSLIGKNKVLQNSAKFKLPIKKSNHFPFWWELI
jgi:glycosyltransferase involved in cell wall biosynthesis